MKSSRVRRLAFELLESKASPSAILLAVAPLDEAEQRAFEAERVMYASITVTHATQENAALLEFIERNTHSVEPTVPRPLPTAEEAAAADTMMAATDTDLRTMLIAEMLNAGPADHVNVFSVIQF